MRGSRAKMLRHVAKELSKHNMPFKRMLKEVKKRDKLLNHIEKGDLRATKIDTTMP